jgi:hypothetical protein
MQGAAAGEEAERINHPSRPRHRACDVSLTRWKHPGEILALSISKESARLFGMGPPFGGPFVKAMTRERQTMHKAILVGLLAAGLTAPVAAFAQPAASAPARAAEDVVTVRPAQWLAIGAGVVVGAAVLDVIMPSNVAFVVGGVVGGYLANVWYGGREVQIQMTTTPRS